MQADELYKLMGTIEADQKDAREAVEEISNMPKDDLTKELMILLDEAQTTLAKLDVQMADLAKKSDKLQDEITVLMTGKMPEEPAERATENKNELTEEEIRKERMDRIQKADNKNTIGALTIKDLREAINDPETNSAALFLLNNIVRDAKIDPNVIQPLAQLYIEKTTATLQGEIDNRKQAGTYDTSSEYEDEQAGFAVLHNNFRELKYVARYLSVSMVGPVMEGIFRNNRQVIELLLNGKTMELWKQHLKGTEKEARSLCSYVQDMLDICEIAGIKPSDDLKLMARQLVTTYRKNKLDKFQGDSFSIGNSLEKIERAVGR